MVGRHPLRLVAPLLVAAALAACSGGDDEGTTSTTTTAGPSTTAEAAPTAPTGSTEPTTTAPTGPTAFTTEARDAANELKAAWETGDQARARAIAPGDVVDALFAVPPDGFVVYGCDTGRFDTSSCNFRNRATGVYITVTMARSEPGWQVDSLTVTQD